ncbi:MAG: tetratricopeptide repeat protein [Actinobacteria bacterium]|nr:tetratricopeptide repeat protein [Actinomycetota bacterium]
MKRLAMILIVVVLAGAMLQWGLDRTPAGSKAGDRELFPSASSVLDLLGGARQYLAYNMYIKTDTLHHTYYGSFVQEAELVPYLVLVTYLDPHYESAFFVGTGIIDALGQHEEALAFNLRGIEANPESADLYYSLGDLYLEEKEYGKAREAFEKALQYEPEIVSRNMVMLALESACHALGDEEAQRRFILLRAQYSLVALYRLGLDPVAMGDSIRKINDMLNTAAGLGRGK